MSHGCALQLARLQWRLRLGRAAQARIMSMSRPTTIIVMTSRKHHLERADRWLRSARDICTLASAVRSAARVMLDCNRG